MHVPPRQSAPRQRWLSTEASAWVVLTTFFVVSLGCLGGLAWLGLRYRNAAMKTEDGAQLRSHVKSGVLFQEPRTLSYTSIERLPAAIDPCPGMTDICMPLQPGYRIKIMPESGYGPVASLVLPDHSHIQFFSLDDETEVLYERYQVSRWTNHKQNVNFVQTSGYARYDLTTIQPYETVEYSVTLPDGYKFWMTPGGSYSVSVIPAHPEAKPATQRTIEVAVRSGSATMAHDNEKQSVSPGHKIAIIGNAPVATPTAATWELIQDPDWNALAKRTTLETTMPPLWIRYSRTAAPDMSEGEKNGVVSVIDNCRPPFIAPCPDTDKVKQLRMERSGTQTRTFAVGVEQALDADISEFAHLRLSGWIRILPLETPDKLKLTCQVKIQLIYKVLSPADPQRDRTFCIYPSTDKAAATRLDGRSDVAANPSYSAVKGYTWVPLALDLRADQLLSSAHYLQQIRFEADGMSYYVEITKLSLLGTQ